MSNNNSILLHGLDGSNPLAFLAALGTLRTLTLALPDETVKMNWEEYNCAWRPRAWGISSEEHSISLISQGLVKKRSEHSTRFVGDNEEIDAFYRGVRAGNPIVDVLEPWVSALANDVHPNATNQLQTTRRDYFAGNIDQILANTDTDALRRTLFSTWRYDDKLDGQSLHLEPTEDRRHAYQWNKPSGDPNRKKSGNMLGANRLAIEALPFFLGLPSTNQDRLYVIGWSGVRSDDSRWTWPVWRYPVPMKTVHSLLSFPELQNERPNRTVLGYMGIGAIFRCRRILVEQTPNLTPSVSVG
jgi:CRISPR-associated endonuclease/helicase Cas3